MSNGFRYPMTWGRLLLAFPFYLLLWLIVQLFVRPFVGAKYLNQHAGFGKGQVFGEDVGSRMLRDVLIILAILFAVFLFIFVGCAHTRLW